MKWKRIALGSDHAGYKLKERIKNHLKSKAYAVVDFGTNSDEPIDYPNYIRPAAESVTNGKNDLGIVFGGSGNGEAMVANKKKRIRCWLCWNEESARLTKEHNIANLIALGERMLPEEEAVRIVDAWLNTEFKGERHLRRNEKIEDWDS